MNVSDVLVLCFFNFGFGECWSGWVVFIVDVIVECFVGEVFGVVDVVVWIGYDVFRFYFMRVVWIFEGCWCFG